MTNENHPKVRDLLDNYEDYLRQLTAMPDKKLERKLILARQQAQMALDQKKFVEVDVLSLFADMIIEARMKRSEMGLDEDEEQKPARKKSSKKVKEKKITPVNDELPASNEVVEEESKPDSTKAEQLSLFQ